jgi:hypothetical protein
MYVSLLVDSGVPDHDVREVVTAFHFNFRPMVNRFLRKQFPGYTFYSRAGPFCDCGVAIARPEGPAATEQMVSAAKIRKLRRRGWTAARFAKWEAQRVSVTEATRASRVEELARWEGFLTRLVHRCAPAPVGVLLHEYTGTLEEDKIRVSGRETMRVGSLHPALAAGLVPDVCYEIRR